MPRSRRAGGTTASEQTEDRIRNPNATVSYMAAQAERQLVDAKAARAWTVVEAARDRTPGAGPIRLPVRLLAALASRFGGHHRTVTTPPSLPHAARGMADPAR